MTVTRSEKARRKARPKVALKLAAQWEGMKPENRRNLARHFVLADEAFDAGRMTKAYAAVAVRNPWRPPGWRELIQDEEK